MTTYTDTADREDLLGIVGNTTGKNKFGDFISEIRRCAKEVYPQLSGLQIEHSRSIDSFAHNIMLSAFSPINGKQYQRLINIGEFSLMTDSENQFNIVKENIDIGLKELSMSIYGALGGGGAGGGYYVNDQSATSCGSSYGSTPYDNWGTPSYTNPRMYIHASGYDSLPVQTKEEKEQQEREERARERMETRRIIQAKKDYSLSTIPGYQKHMMLDTLQETLNAYNYRKGVNNMTKGIKWLLFFFGFAVLLNFGRILDIIATTVQ